jgi:hypothetical protein
MVATCSATVGEWHHLKRELFAAQHAKLAIAYHINWRRANARERPDRKQRPPHFAPVFIGDTDPVHASVSKKRRDTEALNKSVPENSDSG